MATDTRGAIEDLRLAKSYIDDWWSDQDNQKALSLAAKYVNQAMEKDSAAKLDIVEGTARVSYSSNDLAGEVLYLQVSGPNTARKDEQRRRDAEILKRAIAHCPHVIKYRTALAELYLDLYDKPSALAAARDAVKVNPGNIYAQKFLDRIEGASDYIRPTFIENNPGFVTWCGWMLMTVGFFFALFSIKSTTSNRVIFVPMIIIGGIIALVGRYRETNYHISRALGKDTRRTRS